MSDAKKLTGSVGENAKNAAVDVKNVKTLLNSAAYLTGSKLLTVNDSMDTDTISAIEIIQKVVLKFGHPDGRIDPGGKTIKALNEINKQVNGSLIAWPLKQNVIRGRILNNTFGMVRNGGKKPHQGWDFEAKIGTPSFAVCYGKVVFVRDVGAYGKQLCISFIHNKKTYYAFYAHMKSISVSSGNIVTIKQRIGQTGNSGNAITLPRSEDHLHFEIRTNAYAGLGLGGRVSPMKIYKKCPLKSPAIQN
ncbi:MAG: M23 family metallopeptidase [Candidatus Thiodiazotropha sp.]